MPTDSITVNDLLKKFQETYYNDPAKSFQYAYDANEISSEIGYIKGITFSNYYLAILFSNSNFDFAEERLLVALENIQLMKNVQFEGKIYNIAGMLNNNKHQYNEAIWYFEKAVQCFRDEENNVIDTLVAPVYNNLAISFVRLGEITKAIDYYFKALEINRKSNQYYWIATNLYNIGNQYLSIDDYANSFKYLDESLMYANQYKINSLIPYLKLAKSEAYLDFNQFEKALAYARQAYQSAKEQRNYLQERNSLEIISQCYHFLDLNDSAYYTLTNMNAIVDSINQNSKNEELQVLKLKYSYEEKIAQQEYQNQLNQLSSRKKRSELLAIIIVLVILVLIMGLLIRNFNLKVKRNKIQDQLIQLERENLQKELEYKNKEIALNNLYLSSYNELIQSLDAYANNLDNDIEINRINIENLIGQIRIKASSRNWDDFQISFKEVDQEFYKKLHHKFPGLNKSEVRLAALLKLNLSTKEIINLTHQTESSVKTARHRLRKKLGLSRDDNFTSFLNNL